MSQQTLEVIIAKTLKSILAVPEPELKLRALSGLMEKLDAAREITRKERLKLAAELRDQGLTWRRIEDLSGLSTVYLVKAIGSKRKPKPVEELVGVLGEGWTGGVDGVEAVQRQRR